MEGKASVLIVDDNASLCRTLSFVLRRKGYDSTTVSSGMEAIEKVGEMSFDMILMDIKMPVMDGVESFKKIKKVRPEAAVVMMTAYSVEDMVREALKEGAYGIVYKPLDIEKVVSLIERARKGGQGALILVVDDDPGTCATLKNILARKGYQVGVTGTGEEAIAMAKMRAYDIIFIDLRLLTINGLETYLAINEVNPEAVAVIMTGYQQEMAELVKGALGSNAYACLYKPIDIAELLVLVDEIMERKKKAG